MGKMAVCVFAFLLGVIVAKFARSTPTPEIKTVEVEVEKTCPQAAAPVAKSVSSESFNLCVDTVNQFVYKLKTAQEELKNCKGAADKQEEDISYWREKYLGYECPD